MTPDPKPHTLADLQRLMDEYFDTDDFEQICFELSLRHDDFMADSLTGRTRKLLSHLQQTGRLAALVAICREHRPNVTWPEAGQLMAPAPTRLETATASRKTPPPPQALWGLPRWALPLLGVALLALMLWAGSGLLPGRTEVTPPATGVATTAVPRIVLIGRQDLSLGQAANSLQAATGFAVSVNASLADADLVLFTVHAPDGPMPATRTEIQRREGETAVRAAILLTGVDGVTDPELRQLVTLEFRQLLAGYIGETSANGLEIVLMPDPNLKSQIEALLVLPPANLPIQTPNP